MNLNSKYVRKSFNFQSFCKDKMFYFYKFINNENNILKRSSLIFVFQQKRNIIDKNIKSYFKQYQ